MDKSLLLYLEEDLKGRYSFFEEISNIETMTLNLKNILLISKWKTLLARFTFKKKIDREYKLLKKRLEGIDKVILSNSEGFIAKNIIEFIKKDFPAIKLITFQHGIFALDEENKLLSKLKGMINAISKKCLGYYLIGNGSATKTTDKYVVCNHLYKDFLVQRGWKPNEVIVSSFILKGEKPVERIELKQNETAVFFLQCLSKLGLASKENEQQVIKKVVEQLAGEYKQILIKQHPYADIEMPILPANASVIETVPPIESISIVLSFFSAAVLDFEKYGIPAISIKTDLINANPLVYNQFKYIHDFDQSVGESQFKYKLNPVRKDVAVFYEPGEMDIGKI